MPRRDLGMGQPRSRRVEGWLLGIGVALLGSGCYGDRSPVDPLGGSELQRATVGLTERLESESFVFHFQPGDGRRIQVARSEAFHDWAVGYLQVVPPKKIDFYMFRSREEIRAAFGYGFGGWSIPSEFALATAFSWHNHECFHLYISLIGNPPRIFAEGMAVAHEYDPYNDVWVSQWNRAEPHREPHFDIARQLKADGLLYPLDSILESDDFNRAVQEEVVRIAYEQAGAWVGYLVETYGIDPMREIVASIPYAASRETIHSRFEAVYGVSVAEAEVAWLAWLDR
jgi:hypothetical protein